MDGAVLLSIVIVSFNTRKMTEECLKSVFDNSSMMNVQVIVVDNDSKDGSCEMLEKQFPSVILIRNKENRGFASANNQAFEYCTGKYILLLNSDTIVLDDALLRSVNFLEENKEVGGMGCRVLNTDRTLQRTCSGFPTLGRLLFMTLGLDRLKSFSAFDSYLYRFWERNDIREVEVISGCYLMVRKEVLDDTGKLDERFFFFGEETDWCYRMAKTGWRLLFFPYARIVHHGGGSVKKLQYKRDVMLTSATVMLHRKYHGIFGAVMAYIILMLFNGSRAIFWTFLAVFNRSLREKSVHFINVVRAFRQCWPEYQGK